MARELAGTGAKILIVERGDFIPQEDHNWNPASVLEGPALPHDRNVARRDTARAFRPYTHYCVGGNTKFWGTVMYRLRPEDFREMRARRRRVAGVADRLRHAGAVLRSRRADVRSARRGRRRSDRGAARAVSVSAGPALQDRRRDRRTAESAGTAPVAAAARDCARTASSAIPATRSRARSTRRATRRCARVQPGDAAGERHAVDQRHRRASWSRMQPAARSRPSRSNAAASRESVGAARDRVVRRGEFGGAAAALGDRQASGGSRQLIRPRRQALHGAPGDHDAGLSPVSDERHGVSEDGGDQRFLLEGPARSIRSARSSRRAAPTA